MKQTNAELVHGAKRLIGIRHRTKGDDHQPRPTMVAVSSGGKVFELELDTDTAELDFVLGRLPVAWRDVQDDDDLSMYLPRHLHQKPCSRTVRKDEDVASVSAHLLWESDGKRYRIVKVPVAYDGLQQGDVVAMSLGGSGDRLAFALSNRGDTVGAAVLRVSTAALKDGRGSNNKDDDHRLLAVMADESPELFYQTDVRDRSFIRMRSLYELRVDAMKARMACAQRLRQREIGRIFLSPEGQYPEGEIEVLLASAKENDTTFQALMAEEKRRVTELTKAVHALDIWPIFDAIEGVGPLLAAPLITAIGDPRRFQVEPDYSQYPDTPDGRKKAEIKAVNRSVAKLCAYLGVHVLNGGKHGEVPVEKQFPRRRAGAVANWKMEGRQALYLMVDQFNRRPNSEWGLYFRRMKVAYRQRHPESVEVVNAKGQKVTRYTDGHIHKLAGWRTTTRLVRFIYREWMKYEMRHKEA